VEVPPRKWITGRSSERQRHSKSTARAQQAPFLCHWSPIQVCGVGTLRLNRLSPRHVGPIECRVEAAECVCIHGASGSGKTLLLRAIADLDPHQGEASLDGAGCSTLPPPEWRRSVALVVAETAAQATAALSLIQVDYEDLPIVTDPLRAMQPDSQSVHPERGSNVVHSYHIRRGDVASALAAADVVIEQTYTTHAQEHAYLQPEAGLALVDESGVVTVYVAGQWVHEDRKEIAHALGLPLDQVRVIYPAIGGAFGGREDMSVQIVLALAAMKLRRPVKLVWTREETTIGHHKRHPAVYRCRTGATRDGHLVAASVELITDGGAYASTSTKVLGNATIMAIGPYECPNVHIDAYTVYTNNVPSGAFRGFGAPQSHFAAESQMNKLAEALGMDPFELRLRNCWHEGSIQATRSAVPPGSTGLSFTCSRRSLPAS